SHGPGDGAPAGGSAPGEMVGPPPGKSSGRCRGRPSRFSSMTDLDPLTETAIVPSDAYAANRANWDDRATVHATSRAYDLDGLVADPARISSVIAEDLELLRPHLPAGAADSDRPLAGLDVCHLQCHIGTDTLSLARLGGHLT